MKKILSFLTKKPLALAAVALFSLAGYAEDTTGDVSGDGITPGASFDSDEEVEAKTYNIWARVSENNPLSLFDMVTVVDEKEMVQYADDGADEPTQIQAVPFVKGQPAENSSFFYVWEGLGAAGSEAQVFNLNKFEKPTEADKSGISINIDGELENRTVTAEVSWLWEGVATKIVNSSDERYFLFYDKEGAKIFKATRSRVNPAVLYKATKVKQPTFDPEAGTYKVGADEERWIVEITNNNTEKDPLGEGTLLWRFKAAEGEDEAEWQEYEPDAVDLIGYLDKGPVTIEAKVGFGAYDEKTGEWENETGSVESTYTLITLADPVIAPETAENYDAETGVLKIDANGFAYVVITETTDGAAVKYAITEGEEGEAADDITDEYTTKLDLASYVGKKVTVSAIATKSGLKSNVVTATYTIEKFNPNGVDFVFFTDPKTVPAVEEVPVVEVGQTIALWFELPKEGAEAYAIEPNEDVEIETLTLTFGDEEVEVETTIADGKYTFVVPEGHLNQEFTVVLPENAYVAYTGGEDVKANKEFTEAAEATFKTSLGPTTFAIDPETKHLTTDSTTAVFQIYPESLGKNAEVEFSPEALAKDDPSMGASLTQQLNKKVTTVTSVEKVEGTPNSFKVTFVNEKDKDQFIKDFLSDDLLPQKGYILGFDAGTFVSGEYTNSNNVSSHIFFHEAIELTYDVEPVTVCEMHKEVALLITATGKVTGEDYAGVVKFNETEDPLFITGTNWMGEEVEVEVDEVIPAPDDECKDRFLIRYGSLVLTEDNREPYILSVPSGAFSANYDINDAFTKEVNVWAHVVWDFTIDPYDYEEGSEGATELTINVTSTIDEWYKDGENADSKSFRKDIFVRNPEAEITVDDKPVKWAMGEVTGPFANEDGIPCETTTFTLTLDEPIADVAEHTVVIPAHMLGANICWNGDDVVLTAKPKVTYGIENIKYIIATNSPSVTYNLYAKLPDDSRLDKIINYIGETEEGKQTEENALAYNDAKNPTDAKAKYPILENAKSVLTTSDADGKPVTTVTVEFPAGTLIPNNYKMNFPAGSVQIEGYNESEKDLYNMFDVRSALAFDATSSEADYNDPAKEDKKKEYNISTSTESITLYLTAVDLYAKYLNNANKSIELTDGTELVISKDGEEFANAWVNKVEGEPIYTVTFEEGEEKGKFLPEGTYTMTVPAGSVAYKNIPEDADDTYAVDAEGKTSLKNPEAFELTINVEDFAAPEELEITTKTWTFDVKVSDAPVTVAEGAKGTLNGGDVYLSTSETAGNITVTMPALDNSVYVFQKSSGATDYTLTIPAGSFTGEYATNYEDLTAKVKVIFEFVDWAKDWTDEEKDGLGNSLTSTKAEVEGETGEHAKMYYTRKFTSTNLQPLAVPFDIKQSDVADYFTIYRISAAYEDEEGETYIKFFPVKDTKDKDGNVIEGVAKANKPYAIIPTDKAVEEGIVTIQFGEKEGVKYVVNSPEIADNINSSTTLTTFKFINTIEETAAEDGIFMLAKGKLRHYTDDAVPEWRWYMTTEGKLIENVDYVKVIVDGVDDATGIDFVQDAEGDTQIFNVAGQKLNTAAKGKVNIINGKKVFVK